MTEDQAKEKWCPFARSAPLVANPMAAQGFGWSSNGPTREQHMCIGSQCMAWRVNGSTDTKYERTMSLDPKIPAPVIVKEHGKPTGYCGLAGKP